MIEVCCKFISFEELSPEVERMVRGYGNNIGIRSLKNLVVLPSESLFRPQIEKSVRRHICGFFLTCPRC